METEIIAGAATAEYTMWALFARATIVVKLVMIMLVLCSFWTWAIVIQKTILFRKARTESTDFDAAFWSGEPLDELFDQIGPEPAGASQRVFAAGMMEWRRSHRNDGGLIAGATSRIDRSMDVAIAKEADQLQSGLTVLATIGSAAPFIGLFGTVWGIMHSFIEIARAQNTSLAVVAASPAVIYYNKLSADADRIIGGYGAFADEFSTILSRQLDS